MRWRRSREAELDEDDEPFIGPINLLAPPARIRDLFPTMTTSAEPIEFFQTGWRAEPPTAPSKRRTITAIVARLRKAPAL